jgi:cell shape-determining protein MreD
MRSRIPKGLIVGTLLVFAVVVQTTLFNQIRSVSPNLVIRPELVLGIAFLSGLLVDMLGSSLMGLRAVVFTTVAYIALRTRDRAEIGRFAIAIWAGILSLAGVVLLVLVGTLFGQTSLLGANLTQKILIVPIANLVIAAVVAPLFVRLVDGDPTAVRFT